MEINELQRINNQLSLFIYNLCLYDYEKFEPSFENILTP